MANNTSKTKYVTFEGLLWYPKVYAPDEFRGAVRWVTDFVFDDDEELKKFKESGIQLHLKEKEYGNRIQLKRPTTKIMGGKVVKFTPPFLYNKDGTVMVKYVDKVTGADLRSYEGEKEFERVGEPVLIANGSRAVVNISTYPTAMGIGNRLESIRFVDLIEYKPEDNKEETNDRVPW